MFKVIEGFHDLQDNLHEYKAGDTYPREGLAPTPERIAELSGPGNRRGSALIVPVRKRTGKK